MQPTKTISSITLIQNPENLALPENEQIFSVYFTDNTTAHYTYMDMQNILNINTPKITAMQQSIVNAQDLMTSMINIIPSLSQ